MKKVKISELPLFTSLEGLYTIGTNNQNQSVKVSLEFVADETQKAVESANAATEKANTAAATADTATEAAKTATTNADNATDNAKAATEKANKATDNATTATANADAATKAAQEAKSAADTATENANAATAAAKQATEDAQTATEAADKATQAAEEVAERVLTLIGQLVPTSLTVEEVGRLTYGNLQPVYINATLTPEQVKKNIIYISDGKSVTVSPDGRLSIVGTGRSTIQVIPTVNTALAKVIQVEVGDPTLRMNTLTSMRFTSAGGMRLN